MSIRNVDLYPHAIMVGDVLDWVATPFAINYGHNAKFYYEDDYVVSEYNGTAIESHNIFELNKEQMEDMILSFMDYEFSELDLSDDLDGIFTGYNAKLYNTISIMVVDNVLKVMIFNIGSIKSEKDELYDAELLLKMDFHHPNVTLVFDYSLFRATVLMYDEVVVHYDSESNEDSWVRIDNGDEEIFSSIKRLLPSSNVLSQLKEAYKTIQFAEI